LSPIEKAVLASSGAVEGAPIPTERLPKLSYDVLNFSEGDSQADVERWLKREGVDGVVHRVSMGVDGVDQMYDRRSTDATTATYRWGAYHFIRQQGSAEDQAAWFIKTLSKNTQHPRRVLLVIDAEYLKDSNSSHPTVQQIIRCAQAVRDLTGVYPGIYTGQDFLSEQFHKATYDASAKQVLRYAWLWVARYSKNLNNLTFPEVTLPPWEKWTLWQVSDDHHPTPMLASMRAEINVYKGTSEELAEFWDIHSWDYKLLKPLPATP
jgi:GH25 family lysozyme M1 (1,4-beta-N-acetylmuramidase)